MSNPDSGRLSGEEYLKVNDIGDFILAVQYAIERERPDDVLEFLERFVKGVDRPKVVMMGGPASGKGTQCEKLVKHLGIIHVSTGDILRDEVRAGTELGARVKGYLNDGRLVPDSLITDLVRRRLAQTDVLKKGWVLDGFPRTPQQAAMMRKAGIAPDCVVRLDVPDSLIISRISGRRIDPLTRKVYHLPTRPPPPGVKVIQRADDTPETVKGRLASYYQHLDPLLKEYSSPVFTIKVEDGDDAVITNNLILARYQKLRWGKLMRKPSKI